MYGAMIAKYISGAESFVDAISFTIFNDIHAWEKKWEGYFDPYYFGLLVFGLISLAFCFGNIENSKYLQLTTTVMRFVVVVLFYIGTVYYIGHDGVHAAPVFDFAE